MKISPVAYSYIRFSTPEQRKGDSLRRQTEAAVSWCDRNGVPLDTTLTLHDKGCSAYKGIHRENPDKHALALFLKLVERGRVHPGDFLLIENLDRLSREEEVPACHLLTGILLAEVRVVQLAPYEMLLTEKSNGWELMRAVMELSRGHGESKIKSERVDKAWQQRLVRTRRGEVVLTHSLPAWVEERGGKLHLIPGRGAAVKRIFHLAATGYGIVRIAKTLQADGVQPFGGREEHIDEEGKQRWRAAPGDCYGSGRWTRAYVHKLLNDRRTLGVFQPLKADGSEDGPSLPNYFPPVITQMEWDNARAGTVSRGQKNGRKCLDSTKHVDSFSGLIRDVRDGGAMYATTRTAQGRHTRILINANAKEGRVPVVTFPHPVFERGILSMLREISASEITEEDTAPNEAAELSAELSRVEDELAQARSYLAEKGFSRSIADHVTTLEVNAAELGERLTQARQAAAHPLAESWGEFQSLADALDNAPEGERDERRVRIRTALRRNVETIVVLIAPRRGYRLCYTQVWFKGSEQHRDFLLLHRRVMRGAAGERPEQAWGGSLDSIADVDVRELDLRRREDAEALEQVLLEMDLTAFTTDERKF